MEEYIELLKEAQHQLTSRNKTIAVKDLTMCHREKVFSIIDPVPMTEGELYDYISGQAAHDVIERLFMIYPNRFRSEKEVQYKNVRGRIDIYDKSLNNIVDIKTSKSQKILLKPWKFHEEQVKYYMSIMDSEEGQIIYEMNNFGKYASFPIFMTADERKKQLEKLEWGERSDYENVEKEMREYMRVEPVSFGVEHKAMLYHAKFLLENKYVQIHPSFDKLITSLRSAWAKDGVR
jgi:hypothetical protein